MGVPQRPDSRIGAIQAGAPRGSRCLHPRGHGAILSFAANADGSAGWSSLVARRAHNPKVIGSNPVPATRTYAGQRHYALWPVFVVGTDFMTPAGLTG